MALQPDLFPAWLMGGSVDAWAGAIATFLAVVAALVLALRQERRDLARERSDRRHRTQLAAHALLHAFFRLNDLERLCRAQAPDDTTSRDEMMHVIEATEAAAQYALSQNSDETGILDGGLQVIAMATKLRGVVEGRGGAGITMAALLDVLSETSQSRAAYEAALRRRRGGRPFGGGDEQLKRIDKLWR